MKLKTSIRSWIAALALALAFAVAAPSVLPTSFTTQAASKKKSSKKKSSKKSSKVNLKINKAMTTVKVGKTVKLKVSGNAKKAVSWSTSDSKVATISSKSGTSIKVKGVKDGAAAITAKVGSKKVVCCVYVGKGTFADANSKTKKAIKKPITVLAAYVKKHPITVTTGNNSTRYSTSYTYNDVYTYALKVVGDNLVVEYNNTDTTAYTYGDVYSNVYNTTLSIPVDGSVTATVTYNYVHTYSSATTPARTTTTAYTFPVNINAISPGVEVQYVESGTNYDGTPYTDSEPSKASFYSASDHLVDILHCFLVDNKVGFTVKDIGFKAYSASHRGIGVLTSSDLAAAAQRNNELRAYNQAHYNN